MVHTGYLALEGKQEGGRFKAILGYTGSLGECSRVLSVAIMNTMTKNKVGRKGLFGFYVPITYCHRGKLGQEPSRGRGGTLLTGSLSMTCSDGFLIQPRTTCPRVSAPRVGWAVNH